MYNNETESLEDIEVDPALGYMIAGLGLGVNVPSSFNCSVLYDEYENISDDINLVVFPEEVELNNSKGVNGSFVILAPTTIHGDFELKNLIVHEDTTLTGTVIAENVANSNNTLTVNTLIADQIIATDLVVEKYLKANTLAATNLYVKKGAVIEVPSGMVYLNGTTYIEENVMMNLTQHRLYAAEGYVSKVQAPLIYLDGNFTLTYPNIPIIVGKEVMLIGAEFNLTIVHTDEGMFNNSYYDGIFLYKGTAFPLILTGQYVITVHSHYPPKNWYKTFELIPNTGMCAEKGGDYVALLYTMFDTSDKLEICQKTIVERRDNPLWYITVVIVGVMLLIIVAVFAFFIFKYKKDKQHEVILV